MKNVLLAIAALCVLHLPVAFGQSDSTKAGSATMFLSDRHPLNKNRGRVEFDAAPGVSFSKLYIGRIDGNPNMNDRSNEVRLGGGGGLRMGVTAGYSAKGDLELSISTGLQINKGRPDIEFGLVRWTCIYFNPTIGIRLWDNPSQRIIFSAGANCLFMPTLRIDYVGNSNEQSKKYEYKSSLGILAKMEFETALFDDSFSYARLGLQFNMNSNKLGSVTEAGKAIDLSEEQRNKFKLISTSGIWLSIGIGSYF